MTTLYAETPQDALMAVQDGITAAQHRLLGVRKAMSGAAKWRELYLKEPAPIHQDLIILEQSIQNQIGILESTIILYGRIVQDVQDTLNN